MTGHIPDRHVLRQLKGIVFEYNVLKETYDKTF